MDKKLRDQLYRLNRELTELDRPREEEEETPDLHRSRGLSRADRRERQRLQELDPIEKRSVPVRKKRGSAGVLFVLALMGILLATGWWQQWLK